MSNEIVVAATDQNDALASFSDYGTNTVDLGAPGENILSLLPIVPAISPESTIPPEGIVLAQVQQGSTVYERQRVDSIPALPPASPPQSMPAGWEIRRTFRWR